MRTVPWITRRHKIEPLLVNQATLKALDNHEDPDSIAESWREEIEQYKERRKATLAETANPLGSTLPAEPAFGGRLAQAQPAFYNAFCKLLSTVNCQSSMMVIVHSVS
jgi:hypothetical protein